MADDNPELQSALQELDRELEVREDPGFAREKHLDHFSFQF
jgi:hypothetical protein